MAISMYLFCSETGLCVWIGDWRDWLNPYGHVLFSGEPHMMKKLSQFLSAHRGKDLIYVDDDTLFNKYSDAREFEEFDWSKHVAACEKYWNEHYARFSPTGIAPPHSPWVPEDGSC